MWNTHQIVTVEDNVVLRAKGCSTIQSSWAAARSAVLPSENRKERGDIGDIYERGDAVVDQTQGPCGHVQPYCSPHGRGLGWFAQCKPWCRCASESHQQDVGVPAVNTAAVPAPAQVVLVGIHGLPTNLPRCAFIGAGWWVVGGGHPCGVRFER